MLLSNIGRIFSGKTFGKLPGIIQTIKASAEYFQTALSAEARMNPKYVTHFSIVEKELSENVDKYLEGVDIEQKIFSVFDKVLDLLCDVNDDENIEKVKQIFDKEIDNISSLLELFKKYFDEISRIVNLVNNTHSAYNLYTGDMKELKRYMEVEKERFESKKSIKKKVDTKINAYKWIFIAICALIPCVVLITVFIKNRKREKVNLAGKV